MAERVLKPKDKYEREEFGKELIDQQNLLHGDMARFKQAVIPKFTLKAILTFLWNIAGAWYWFESEARICELLTMIDYFAYSDDGPPSRRRVELELLATRVDSVLPIHDGNSIHDLKRFSLDGILWAIRETGRIILIRTEVKTTYFPQWVAAALEMLAENYYGGPELAEFTAEMSFECVDWSWAHALAEQHVFGITQTRQRLKERDMRDHDSIVMPMNGSAATRRSRTTILDALDAASARRRRAINDDIDDIENDDDEDNMVVDGE